MKIADDARRQLISLFPGFDAVVWDAQITSWRHLAAKAHNDYFSGRIHHFGLAIVAESFIECLDFHSAMLRSNAELEFAKHDLQKSMIQIGEFRTVKVFPHHRALGIRCDDVIIWIWIGHTYAATDFKRLRYDSVIVVFGVLFVAMSLIVSIAYRSPEWFERSGSLLTAAGGWLAYLSLDRGYTKARKSISRGYWLRTSTGQRWLDRISIVFLLGGTLIWGYGTKLLLLVGIMP